MEWLLLALAGGGAAVFGGRRFVGQRARFRAEQAELEQVRRLADEVVTLFGEQLQRLDAEVGGHTLDAATRADYQRALDAYESAYREVTRLREPDEVSKITDTLATGRYALACVEASTGRRCRTWSGPAPAGGHAPCRPAPRTRPG
jgi:hypothetical protein